MWKGNETGWLILAVIVCALGSGWLARSHSLVMRQEATSADEAPMTRDDDSSEEAAAPRGNVVPPRMYPLRPVTQPDYPDESALFKEEGTVILLLRVGSDGDVVDAWVSKTSGYDRLDQSAVKEAIASWKLKPGTVNGIPTTMDHEFAVRFKLAD